MKISARFVFIMIVALLCVVQPPAVRAQQIGVQGSPVTLYSVNKYGGEQRAGCLSFMTGASYPIWSTSARDNCDLYYGLLYAGEEKDWLQSSAAERNRSVIKDLGLLDWTTAFRVPTVDPLPKLKSGEQRHFSVDTSGADGADGADGAPGEPSRRGAAGHADPVAVPGADYEAGRVILSAAPRPPKHDGKPKVSSLWVKAVDGHMYVIHVVDDARDYYALFRVETLEKADRCTISWMLIPAPDSEAPHRK
ncbi:MAG: hypothetical protein QOJ64_2354 [Acidobacteriota bacterium]|jgi:hypothetical protein|nr:hypothetical protein [Acidobacteriota bacterium]